MTTEGMRRKYEGLIAESVRLPGSGGELIGGYAARPLGQGPSPGVVVIHEAFGLVTHTREMVRKFAAAGYFAVAPDLYWREGTIDPADTRAVMQAMGGLPDARAVGDIEGAVGYLMTLPGCNGKIGSIGHCSGGRHSLLYACNTQSLSAAVDCYGGRVIPDELTPTMPKAVIDMVPDLCCPLLGLFGAADANPTPGHVARLEEALKANNKTYQFHSYATPVGHGFFADYRPSYDQEAAVDGWDRILTFYDEYLR